MEKYHFIISKIIWGMCIFSLFGGCDADKANEPPPRVRKSINISPPPESEPASELNVADNAVEQPSASSHMPALPPDADTEKQPSVMPSSSDAKSNKSETDIMQSETEPEDVLEVTPEDTDSKGTMVAQKAIKTESSKPGSETDISLLEKTVPDSEPVAKGSKSESRKKPYETGTDAGTEMNVTETSPASAGGGGKPKSQKKTTETGTEDSRIDNDILASIAGLKTSSAKSAGAYNPEGKPDPFSPLFKEEKPVQKAALEEKADASSKKKKKRKRRERRTPLEKVELSQLKLVGIIRAQSGNKALVEDASRKGYIVRKGTYIGIHYGKVIEILKDRVVVEEEDENVYGDITYRKRELFIERPPGEDYHEL